MYTRAKKNLLVQFVCNAFSTTGNLKSHKSTHPVVRNYNGEKSFKWKHTLAKHREVHLDIPTPFSCGICDITLREKGNLKLHAKIHIKSEMIS